MHVPRCVNTLCSDKGTICESCARLNVMVCRICMIYRYLGQEHYVLSDVCQFNFLYIQIMISVHVRL